MTNNLAALKKVDYELRVQMKIKERFIGMDLANFELEGSMKGKTIDYPRINFQPIQEYTRYTNLTDVDIDTLNEQLIVDKSIATSFVVDILDEADSQYEFTSEVVNDNAFKLTRKMEQDFLAEGLNADNTDAVAEELTSDNAVEFYNERMAELANTGVDVQNLALVVSPLQFAKIGNKAVDATFKVGDKTYTSNYKGGFMGMELYMTTNLPASTVLALATNPTDGDTVTINNVTFTFKTALTPAAGEVVIGIDADASRTNLAAALNAPLATTATYSAVGYADANKLDGISAVNDGADSVDITLSSDVKVSSNLTAAGDKFGQVDIHNFLMSRGAIHMARKIGVRLVTEKIQSQFGTRYSTLAYYGLKTFKQGAERMYDILVKSRDAEV